MKQEERADPRVLRSKASILDACAGLIAEEGFAGVSIEAVAARSGAAKTTIYRHWPSREALCIEAFGFCTGGRMAAPDTGSLRDDLIAVLSGLAASLNDPAWNASITSLLDAAGRDADVAALHRETITEKRRSLTDVLEGGIARGELPAGLDMDAASAMLAGPVFYWGIVWRQPIDARMVAGVVDAALPGLIAGEGAATSAESPL